MNLDGDSSKAFFSYVVGVLTVLPIAIPLGIRAYVQLGGFGKQSKEMKHVFRDGMAMGGE